MKFFASVFLIFATFGIANAALITSVSNINSLDSNDEYEIDTLNEEVNAFIDRTHQYQNIPAFLLGADFVRVANDDKAAGDSFEILVTLSSSAMVYLFLDDRIDVSSAMPWVLDFGFTDTNLNIGIDENANDNNLRSSSVYSAWLAAGDYTFLKQDDTNSRNMYGIAAVPSPSAAALLVFVSFGLLFRRRVAIWA